MVRQSGNRLSFCRADLRQDDAAEYKDASQIGAAGHDLVYEDGAAHCGKDGLKGEDNGGFGRRDMALADDLQRIRDANGADAPVEQRHGSHEQAGRRYRFRQQSKYHAEPAADDELRL